MKGIIEFEQMNRDGPVAIRGSIQNLGPTVVRGFHIQYVLRVARQIDILIINCCSELGDLSNGCTSTGSHFNPFKTKHGAPEDPITARHAGDLGNITTNASGVAQIDKSDQIISLNGKQSVVG